MPTLAAVLIALSATLQADAEEMPRGTFAPAVQTPAEADVPWPHAGDSHGDSGYLGASSSQEQDRNPQAATNASGAWWDDEVSPDDNGESPRGPLAASNTGGPLAITPPQQGESLLLSARDPAARGNPRSLPGTLVTMAGSLAMVLGLFFLVAWCLRRRLPGGAATLPPEVVETLGRSALLGRQNLYLLRCGTKLLLVWASNDAVETLTEITDPVEVDRLAGLCQRHRPHSASADFRDLMQQLGREPAGSEAGTARDAHAAPRAGSLASARRSPLFEDVDA